MNSLHTAGNPSALHRVCARAYARVMFVLLSVKEQAASLTCQNIHLSNNSTIQRPVKLVNKTLAGLCEHYVSSSGG